MIRTKLAKKVLTKKEQRHLTEANIHSMAAMKRQVEFQRNTDFPCFECRHIASKLDLKNKP